jgi:hypothetical protein
MTAAKVAPGEATTAEVAAATMEAAPAMEAAATAAASHCDTYRRASDHSSSGKSDKSFTKHSDLLSDGFEEAIPKMLECSCLLRFRSIKKHLESVT